MNETLKVIAERYSCRNFTSEMPTDEQLRAIAEAAVAAPSGVNRQAWRVIVVKNRQLIEEMEAEAMGVLAQMEMKDLYNHIMERGGRMFYGAPCMFAIPVAKASSTQVAMDCGILCENVVLAATSLGLGNLICGLAALAFEGDKVEYFKEKLGFPEGYDFGIAVLLGYSAAKVAPHEPDLSKISYVE